MTSVQQILSSVQGTITHISDVLSPKTLFVPSLITKIAVLLRNYITSAMGPYRLLYVDLHSISFWEAVVVIFIHPCLWNCIGRFQYYTGILSRVFIKPIFGVYALALWIFLIGLYRDVLFNIAINHQQTVPSMDTITFQITGISLIVCGTIFVFTSFYQLGFSGTYLGDYFGILMDHKVTAFPFNILDDPMYDGSTLIFLGKAILSKSMAGVILSMWVYMVYRFVSLFEGPFTEYIYSNKDKGKDKTKTN